jgi:pyruvate/2-oxoglutarate dehydrogenase complex dihydrolipoamide acyltransferase (E2) component
MTDGPSSPSYQTRRYPTWRAVASDLMKAYGEKNYIHGFLEIDVTEPRRVIHDYKDATGGDFSFTAFLISCLAIALGENKSVQALRQGNKLVTFDDVDVNVQVARDMGGETALFTYIVRKANEKTARQIHDEIRAVQSKKMTIDDAFAELPRAARLAMILPSFLRVMVFRSLLTDPFFVRDVSGTCDITAIGMFGKEGGWGLPIPETSLDVTIGGIEKKQHWTGEKFEPREMLSVSVSFDHDIVDGAPATQFTMRFKDLIQAAHGLEELVQDKGKKKKG